MKFQIVFLIVTIALVNGGVIKNFQCPSAGNFLDESSMDPKKYISCEENKNGKIVAKYKDCDEKEVFDFDTQTCVAQSAKSRKLRQDFNFQCHETGFFADFSTDCTGFFVCQSVNGVIELIEHKKCDSGDVFWPESETCVPPAAYQCPMTSTVSPTTEAVTTPAEPTTTTEKTTTTEEPTTTTTTEEPTTTTTTEEPTTTTTTEEPTTTTEGSKFQCSQQGQFHDECNCRKYYQCVEYEGKLVTLHLQCKPENLVFHKDLKYCVAKDLYPCSK